MNYWTECIAIKENQTQGFRSKKLLYSDFSSFGATYKSAWTAKRYDNYYEYFIKANERSLSLGPLSIDLKKYQN